MPEFKVSIERNISDYEFVSFDCYCGECGKGICSECDADSYGMKLTINLCPVCKKTYEDVIKSLEQEVEELKDKLNDLE